MFVPHNNRYFINAETLIEGLEGHEGSSESTSLDILWTLLEANRIEILMLSEEWENLRNHIHNRIKEPKRAEAILDKIRKNVKPVQNDRDPKIKLLYFSNIFSAEGREAVSVEEVITQHSLNNYSAQNAAVESLIFFLSVWLTKEVLDIELSELYDFIDSIRNLFTPEEQNRALVDRHSDIDKHLIKALGLTDEKFSSAEELEIFDDLSITQELLEEFINFLEAGKLSSIEGIEGVNVYSIYHAASHFIAQHIDLTKFLEIAPVNRVERLSNSSGNATLNQIATQTREINIQESSDDSAEQNPAEQNPAEQNPEADQRLLIRVGNEDDILSFEEASDPVVDFAIAPAPDSPVGAPVQPAITPSPPPDAITSFFYPPEEAVPLLPEPPSVEASSNLDENNSAVIQRYMFTSESSGVIEILISDIDQNQTIDRIDIYLYGSNGDLRGQLSDTHDDGTIDEITLFGDDQTIGLIQDTDNDSIFDLAVSDGFLNLEALKSISITLGGQSLDQLVDPDTRSHEPDVVIDIQYFETMSGEDVHDFLLRGKLTASEQTTFAQSQGSYSPQLEILSDLDEQSLFWPEQLGISQITPDNISLFSDSEVLIQPTDSDSPPTKGLVHFSDV
ncbi:hypothetical protein PN498_11705 [Oscillatoria sp. CS-180]|uniref:hypothetical protein n=1 Tax=Oscillatoria sp. CS-180 TaxID=3021720 RepID=UPI00232E4302|nr:hypothetical protein [Oscillatoria sp. CS-180]MDB9526658.1 hypothetical protein [Oscillatoria sp. CS-180]